MDKIKIAKKPTMLMILDGFGMRDEAHGNAIAAAKTPNLDRIFAKYPGTRLDASGLAVGLPEGQMGNSEVGHLNIGAGRVVYQELTRITKSIKDGEFFENSELLRAMNHARTHNSALHLLGLLSDGGVHSHMEHLFALLDMAKANGLKSVYVHCFLDGRDVPPQCALSYIEALTAHMNEIGIGQIALVSGRYYAMDRDKRYERLAKAYDAMTLGPVCEKGSDSKEDGPLVAATACAAVDDGYARGETDEFVLPTCVLCRNMDVDPKIAAMMQKKCAMGDAKAGTSDDGCSPNGDAKAGTSDDGCSTNGIMGICGATKPCKTSDVCKMSVVCPNAFKAVTVNDNDAMIMFNFRPDRAREITRAFIDPEFDGFARKKVCKNLCYVCMTQYDVTMPNVTVAFPPQTLDNTLGDYVSSLGLKQLRIAETEKYAHVTFFFNGGVEEPRLGEDRILVPSPMVATYDMQPEMSAPLVCEKVVSAIRGTAGAANAISEAGATSAISGAGATSAISGAGAANAISECKYDMIILNFANADMVGHTGVFDAAVAAVEALDKLVPQIVDAVLEAGGQLLITADHGNADYMLDDAGNVMTAHSLSQVPLVYVGGAVASADAEGIGTVASADAEELDTVASADAEGVEIAKAVPSGNSITLADGGRLCDIAPTMLDLMGLEIPKEMTGKSLVR